jgi:hydrogenase-4 component F
MGVVLFAASARGVLPNASDATMWRSLVGVAGSLDPALVKAGFLFVLVGFGTKAGIAPMHAWLPDAHSQAPGPVSAVFSGSLLNSAMYCLMRFLPIVQGAQGGGAWALDLLVVFGLLSILLAAAFMVFQRDLKRLLAYSSVEHIGIVALGLGLGPAGAFAGLFHVLNHSTTKSVGFLAAGRLGQLFGSLDMRRMRGASAVSPLWGGALVVSLLALIGMAPFAVFLSEFLVLKAAADAGAWAVVVLFVVGTSIVFAGVLRHLIAIGWGEGEAAGEFKPGPRWEIALPAVPLAAVFVLGLWMPALMRTALDQATRIIAGGP